MFSIVVNFSLFFVLVILIVASSYDLRFAIVPNKLSLILISFAILINMIFSILLNSFSYFLFSLILALFVFLISLLLWNINFWGGGDLKLFVGMALSLSFLELNNSKLTLFYPIFDLKNSVNFPDLALALNHFNYINQFIFYPRIFSILFNAILMVFPLLFIWILIQIHRKNDLKIIFILADFIFVYKSLIYNRKFYGFKYLEELTNKTIDKKDLKEGMVLNKYYFTNEKAYHLIKYARDDYEESLDSEDLPRTDFLEVNLDAYKVKGSNHYFLKSSSMLGLTGDDLKILNCFFEKGYLDDDKFKIKMGIPFVPALTIAFVVFLVFGDLIYIISHTLF
ncbi:A24 family peptidase [uncultured Methanobrevibacter sp.]|uniref:prepilin peptidase n=1 Tax=uncultured Methanobrevibacter sp. TaxID=253161 RepID=UPI0026136CA8